MRTIEVNGHFVAVAEQAHCVLVELTKNEGTCVIKTQFKISKPIARGLAILINELFGEMVLKGEAEASIASARMPGKKYEHLLNVIEMIRLGKEPLYLGIDYVAMSKAKYEELQKKTKKAKK